MVLCFAQWIHVGFIADRDPAFLVNGDSDPVPDTDPGIWWAKKLKTFTVEINKLQKIAIFYPPAFTKDVKAIGEAPSPQKRISCISNKTIFNFFFFALPIHIRIYNTGLTRVFLFASWSKEGFSVISCFKQFYGPDFTVGPNQCCGSVTFWCSYGSADPCLWTMDPDSAPDPAIFVLVHLHHFSKIKSSKEVTKE